jgi:hypothetical protein
VVDNDDDQDRRTGWARARCERNGAAVRALDPPGGVRLSPRFPPPGQPVIDDGPLIDGVLPAYDVASSHAIAVRATPRDVMAAVRRLDLSTSRLTALLLRLRGLPSRALTFDGLLRMGFTIVGERPDREIVLGLVGRFWTIDGDLRRLSSEAFLAFEEPGTARAAWVFRVEPSGEGATRLVTETRVRCADAATRRRFRVYWAVVAPFSGLIRRAALRAIRDDAERAPAAG